jgi:hypothetical protein
MTEYPSVIETVRREATLTSMFDDAKAAGEAALRRDFDETRFRTQQLATKAYGLGLAPLAIAAALLSASLGPAGSVPNADYGAGMLRLADELDAVRFTL